MKRRRYHFHRRTCPHHTKHEGSEPDYGGIRRYCPQQYPVDTCLEPTGHTLRGDRSTLQAEQGYPRAVRTTQHDKRRIPDNKASHGTQGKPRTALHDRLSARREVTKVKLAPLYWHGKRTWSFKQSARMLSSEHPGVSRYPYLHKQETLSIV